jgi:hypothetical protein
VKSQGRYGCLLPLGLLPRLIARGTAAIGNALLQRCVAGYKYRVAADADSLILQLPDAVTGENGTILTIYIAYRDARRDICGYSGYLDLIRTRCKRNVGTSR